MIKQICIAAAALAVTAGAASAADVRVRYNSAELETSAGAERVYRTIQRKADNACGVNERQSITMQRDAKACSEQLVDEIITEIGSENLASERSGDTRIASR